MSRAGGGVRKVNRDGRGAGHHVVEHGTEAPDVGRGGEAVGVVLDFLVWEV